MDEIKWTDDFSIENNRIDEQHKKLIVLLNRMLKNPSAKTDSETVSDVLTEMTVYSKEHFRTEEELMQKFNVPKLEKHKLRHREYRIKTANFCVSTINGIETVPEEILIFLKDWWIKHILEEDMEYKPYLAEKSVV